MSLFHLTHSAIMAKYEGIPGPEPSLPLGTAGEFLKRWPWEVCADYGRTYGGMSLIWLAGTPAIVLNDPDLIGRVLDTEEANYYKRDPHDAVAPVITPDDLFIANGEEWRHLRTASPLNRPYTSGWLHSQVPALRTVVVETADQLVGQHIDDLIEPLRRLVYDMISTAVWGETFEDVSFHDFLKMARVGNGRMLEPPLLQKIPSLDPFFYRDRDRWYASFRERVEKAMAEPGGPENSLLRLALRAGPPVSASDLAQRLSASIFFGGVFSVAAGIAHTLRHLAAAPEIMAGVLAELHDRQPLADAFDFAALEGCERLDHALRESLRVSPPVTLYFRNVNEDHTVELGGHTLPPDTLIFITNWLLHRDPAHWTDAERFQPERWANGGVDRDPPGSGHFFPFGRGPLTCIGQNFAFLLMKLALAVLLTRTRVQLDLSGEMKSDFFFAVQHPKHLKARFSLARASG